MLTNLEFMVKLQYTIHRIKSMARTKKKDSVAKATPKWLTIQITEKQNETLESFCVQRNMSKASVIRDVLDNIPLYAAFKDQVNKNFLETLS